MLQGLEEYTSLESLSIASVSLKSLAGLPPCLTSLSVNDNNITGSALNDLVSLQHLKKLDIAGNRLASVSQFKPLQHIPLTSLELEGNPLADDPSYREQVGAERRTSRGGRAGQQLRRRFQTLRRPPRLLAAAFRHAGYPDCHRPVQPGRCACGGGGAAGGGELAAERRGSLHAWRGCMQGRGASPVPLSLGHVPIAPTPSCPPLVTPPPAADEPVDAEDSEAEVEVGAAAGGGCWCWWRRGVFVHYISQGLDDTSRFPLVPWALADCCRRRRRTTTMMTTRLTRQRAACTAATPPSPSSLSVALTLLLLLPLLQEEEGDEDDGDDGEVCGMWAGRGDAHCPHRSACRPHFCVFTFCIATAFAAGR